MIRWFSSIVLVVTMALASVGCTTSTMYRVSGKTARTDAQCTKHVKPGEYCEKRSEISSRAVLTGFVVGTLLVVAASAGSDYGNYYNGITQGE